MSVHVHTGRHQLRRVLIPPCRSRQTGIRLYRLVFLFAILLWPCMALAGGAPHGKAGTTGASFLKIGVGARPTALGNAYTALSNDANSVYWNPAGLTRFRGFQLSLMHNRWIQDINYEFIGVAYGDSASSGFALGFTFLWMGDIPVTTFSDRLGNSGATFTARDMSLVISYAHQVHETVSLGATLKRIRSTIAEIDARATAVDAGVMITPPLPGLSLGATVQNLGSRLKFVREGDRLPFVYKFGAAYSYRRMVTVAADVVKPVDNRPSVSAGGEFTLFNILALRGGYNSSNELDRGYTAGAGVRIRYMSIDYAFVPYGVLGNTHRISAMLSF